ncbi:hypothetical protein HYU21_04825 [Candidatus Woesearchaeota archaeon]|nr:hypothetical protein [Candidatus Woesearchaeota archaeon]
MGLESVCTETIERNDYPSLELNLVSLDKYRQGYSDGRLVQHLTNLDRNYFLGHKRGFSSKIKEEIPPLPLLLQRFINNSESSAYHSFLQGFFLEEKVFPEEIRDSLTYFSTSKDFFQVLARCSLHNREEQAYHLGLLAFLKYNNLNDANPLVLRHPAAQQIFHAALLGYCHQLQNNDHNDNPNKQSNNDHNSNNNNQKNTAKQDSLKYIFNPPFVDYLRFRAYTFARRITHKDYY